MMQLKSTLFLIFTMVAVGLLCPGCGVSQSEGIVRLNNEQFAEKMKSPGYVILDVRTPEEFQASRIEGAILINVLDKSAFMKKIKALDTNQKYLVYCRSGNRSMTAAKILKDNGFEHIYELQTGIIGWKGPVVSGNE
jgi:rhodanese-related sulfurtransferase